MNKNNRVSSRIAIALLLFWTQVVCTELHAGPAISVLMSHDSAPYMAVLEGFQGFLRDQAVQADYQVMQVKEGGDKQLAGKIDQQDATLIYCIGSVACDFSQQLTPRRPILASMVMTADAIPADAQATGIFLSYYPETQLRWLKKLFPQYRRVGILYNPEENQAEIDRAKGAAKQLGLEIVAKPVHIPKELPSALKSLLREIDILWALPDRVVLAPQTAKEVLLTSFRNRIPVIGASMPWVKGGALYALDWDYTDMGVQAAAMALKLIRGTPINKIPLEEPRTVAYTLNLKTAKHMKLDIPAEVARGAKDVYQ